MKGVGLSDVRSRGELSCQAKHRTRWLVNQGHRETVSGTLAFGRRQRDGVPQEVIVGTAEVGILATVPLAPARQLKNVSCRP